MRRGIPQAELAKLVGTTQASIGLKETERQTFSLEQLLLICEKLRFDPRYIVEDVNIDTVDLESSSHSLLADIYKKIETFDEKQLRLINEFINKL